MLGLATVIAALTDWWAVARGKPRVEMVAKPLVMVLLIGGALMIDACPPAARWWFAGALTAGLVGDIFLLPSVDRFVAGLAAFTVGHGLYIGGLISVPQSGTALLLGVAGAVALMVAVATPIIRAVGSGPLAVAVNVYIIMSALVLALAIGTARPLLGLGAAAFALSDALLGYNRFVKPVPRSRALVHALYHTGQAALLGGIAL